MSASYKLASDGSDTSTLYEKSIYLADANGNTVNKASGASATGGRLTLLNPSASAALNTGSQHAVNVVMTRVQKLTVDVAPSVPRLTETDDNGNTVVSSTIDPTKIDDAVNDFWTSIAHNGGSIKVKYRSVDFSQPGNFSAVKTLNVPQSSFPTKEGAKITSTVLQNVSSINFGLPARDLILFNGVAYAGNEWIDIPLEQMANAEMTFRYYDSEYISALSVMTLNVERIEQYVDANRNGKLDGTYVNGNFVPSAVMVNGKEIKDIKTAVIEEKDYEITNFGPLVDADGNILQQFFKFYYSMTPRSLAVPRARAK